MSKQVTINMIEMLRHIYIKRFNIFFLITTVSLHKVSEVPYIRMLPADTLLRFNFFNLSFKKEYLKLISEVVPEYSNVKKPIFFFTSG